MTTPMLTVHHVAGSAMSLEHLLLAQLQYLRDCGYSLSAASPSGRGIRAVRAAGFPHYPVHIARRADPVSDIRGVGELRDILRLVRPDIVHTHNPKAGLLGRLAAALDHVPVVLHTVHGFHFHQRQTPAIRLVLRQLERMVSNRLTRYLLFQSHEDMATAELAGIGGPDSRRYIGNGIDLERFKRTDETSQQATAIRAAHDIPQHSRVVAFVGRFVHPRKGFLTFVAACRRLTTKGPDVHFLVVGDRDDGLANSEVEDTLDALERDPRFHLTGWLPNHQLPGVYDTADVVVLPSLFEGLPRVVMEASAMGTPVVASDVVGNREALPRHPGCSLVPFGDASACADAISDALRLVGSSCWDPTRLRQEAVERFDQQNVFQRVAEVYAEAGSTLNRAHPR